MNKDAIYEKIKELIISEFKVPAESISPGKRLHDDLQLDSLDMVDLILALSESRGERIDPTLFKEAGTVQDLVDAVSPFWK